MSKPKLIVAMEQRWGGSIWQVLFVSACVLGVVFSLLQAIFTSAANSPVCYSEAQCEDYERYKQDEWEAHIQNQRRP